MDEPKIIRADCTHDFEICDLLVNHLDSSNGTFPYMVMASPEQIYLYEGPLKA